MRVESAETQDYVSGLQGLEELGPAEIEELSFVPSAVSEPRWVLHMCDNKCNHEGFRFYQLAAVVTEGGGAAHTINLCKQCYIERRQKQGEQPVTAARWREREMMEALIAAASRLRTASGGSPQGMVSSSVMAGVRLVAASTNRVLVIQNRMHGSPRALLRRLSQVYLKKVAKVL